MDDGVDPGRARVVLVLHDDVRPPPVTAERLLDRLEQPGRQGLAGLTRVVLTLSQSVSSG